MRRISIIGEIEDDNFLKFCERLAELEAEGKENIELELCSHGGSSYSALAFVGRIRNSRCKIVCKAYGYVASAATLVLAACDERHLSAESWVMVHEDSGKAVGSVSNIEKMSLQYRREEEHWAALMAFHTKWTKEKWNDLHKKETYLTADECLEAGLVDKII